MSKPEITVTDGNVFAILGATSSALRRAGKRKELDEFQKRLNEEQANPNASYHSMLALCSEYVEFNLDTGDEDEDCDEDYEDEEEDEEDSE